MHHFLLSKTHSFQTQPTKLGVKNTSQTFQAKATKSEYWNWILIKICRSQQTDQTESKAQQAKACPELGTAQTQLVFIGWSLHYLGSSTLQVDYILPTTPLCKRCVYFRKKKSQNDNPNFFHFWESVRKWKLLTYVYKDLRRYPPNYQEPGTSS